MKRIGRAAPCDPYFVGTLVGISALTLAGVCMIAAFTVAGVEVIHTFSGR